MKPGAKTTEFWLTLLAALTPLVQSATGIDLTDQQADIAQILAGVTTFAYIVSRAVAKKTEATSAPIDSGLYGAAIQHLQASQSHRDGVPREPRLQECPCRRADNGSNSVQ